MLLFFISCFCFILLSKSFSLKNHHLRVKSEGRLFSPWFWERFSTYMVSWFQKCSRLGTSCYRLLPRIMSLKKTMRLSSNMENAEEDKMTLLDLPELTLECILERLSPAGLCSMAGVCSSFRERCTRDHLWEKHMKQKWGKVIGDAAKREWQWHIASTGRANLLGPSKQNGLLRSLGDIWPFPWFRTNFESRSSLHRRSDLPVDSIMSWYLSLETGKFWFPAQVYNRENGHAGFMLSCYDAKLGYDFKTGTFQARNFKSNPTTYSGRILNPRYSPHGRRTTEESIPWDRLRVPPVDTPSHDLHISDCLLDLKPGDHIEIQWRRTKEFPYGWWYGVVGHMESCDGSDNHCRCQYEDAVMLEFKQYPANTRWRTTMINRKEHREVGNEAGGFYGGIRKLYKEEEISMWKRLWPNHVLE